MEKPTPEEFFTEPETQEGGVTRRDFLVASGVAAAATLLPPLATSATAQSAPVAASPASVAASVAATETPVMAKIAFQVNGQAAAIEVDTRTSLLDAMREHLRLTGTKKGCDHGQCGACTLMVNGARINSCLSLAIMHRGDQITTIEGLGTPDDLHPMQAAFVQHDGYQCGYCTPGQICSAVATLDEIEAGVPSHVTADLTAPVQLTPDEIRERMSGNICRCGAYSNIIEAITEVAGGKVALRPIANDKAAGGGANA